jgi:hypothetical protein
MDEFRRTSVSLGILDSVDDVVESQERRAVVAAEIDVLVARDVFKLTKREMLYILDPDNILGKDCGVETFKALRNAEIREFGQFRTQRLIEEAWDRFDTADAGIVFPIEAPSLGSLSDAAWTWPASVQLQDRLRYAAQHVLWQMDGVVDGARARFAIAGLAEPALLTPWLSDAERGHWVRLVGADAQPAAGVVRLRPAINGAWRSMFETLVTSGQLEERADGTWTRGQHFSSAGLQAASADAQRAAFAIRVAKDIDIATVTAAAAPEDQVIWARFGGGQSS